jgi:glutamine cyclotransferase
MDYEIQENPSLEHWDRLNNVLNGIAYDKFEDVFYMTGKRWNFIYKIRLNK